MNIMIRVAEENQTLLDIILEGCGTLEAAMRVAADNGVPISHIPALGDGVTISDAAVAMSNNEVLHYLKLNGLRIGTKGVIEPARRLVTEDTEEIIIGEDGSDILAGEEG